MKYGYLFAITVSVLLCGCSNITIRKNLNTSAPMAEDLKNVLYYASFAPSGHNTQGWLVNVISEDEWIIKLDSSRLLKEVDPSGRESLISAGAFLENMRVAFKAYSYSADIKLNSNPSNINDNPVIAYVKFNKDESLQKDPSLTALIQKRHTDKRNYSSKPLDTKALSVLEQEFKGKILYFPKGSPEFEYIKQNSYIANQKQVVSAAKTGELADWLRFSDKEAVAKADGLPAEQLGIKGIKKYFYYLIMNREKAKGKAFAESSLKMAKEKLENCAGYFLVLGSDGESAAAGMTVESFWLRAASLDISIHPMSQILEEDGFKKNLETFLKSDQPVQMVFRAGYAKPYGVDNGIRRPISQFVSFEYSGAK